MPSGNDSSHAAQTETQSPAQDTYIVAFHDGVPEPAAKASKMLNKQHIQLRKVYRHVLNGFSAKLAPAAVAALRQNPHVKFIEPNGSVELLAQETPPGIDRVDADLNSLANIDGADDRVDVDIAVIDSGIDWQHPDLNVVGGITTVAGYSPDDFDDDNGHGMRVAGTAGALDNDIGVVGVAPGTRLWAVKVIDQRGKGTTEEILAGMDWVASTRLDDDPHNDIDVANMSLIVYASDDIVEEAVNRLTDTGVVLVAAAGNYGTYGTIRLAKFARTLAVSAVVETDGQPGGLGPSTRDGADDTFAEFSCYGDKIELAAPGVDVLSTWKGGRYKTISGTSMASPHVAGAAGLFIAEYGPTYGSFDDIAEVELVREALIASGQPQDEWGVPDTFDLGVHKEPMVSAANIAASGWVTVPVVNVVSPTEADVLSGDAVVRIDARDVDTPLGGLDVVVEVDGQPLGSAVFDSQTGYYEIAWDTTTVVADWHQIVALAVDLDGNVSRTDTAVLTKKVWVFVENGPPNEVPKATDDSWDGTEDITLYVAAPGVLGNDRDSDLDSLTAHLVSGTSSGTVTLNADGSFNYVPDADFHGTTASHTRPSTERVTATRLRRRSAWPP